MDTKQIQRNITDNKRTIISLEESLVIHRERLARAETQLVEAIVAESKTSELVNGDYGKAGCLSPSEGWVYVGGKVIWDDGEISKFANAHFIDSRRGNFIREMEDARDGKTDSQQR